MYRHLNCTLLSLDPSVQKWSNTHTQCHGVTDRQTDKTATLTCPAHACAARVNNWDEQGLITGMRVGVQCVAFRYMRGTLVIM